MLCPSLSIYERSPWSSPRECYEVNWLRNSLAVPAFRCNIPALSTTGSATTPTPNWTSSSEFIVQLTHQKHNKIEENEGNLTRKVRFWPAHSLHYRFATKNSTIFAASCTPETQNITKQHSIQTAAQQCKTYKKLCFYKKNCLIFEASFTEEWWLSTYFPMKNSNHAY